jgi:hypothetical protein
MITTFLMSLLLICADGENEKAPTIQTQSIVRWEYKLLASDNSTAPEKLQNQLDLLGEQGWELTAIIARRSKSDSDTLIFKRRKASNDVDISFQPEMGLITIRGDKKAVEKTVQVIEEIKKQASPSK